MHGSSSVPQELQDEFNRWGGQMPQTWGVPVDEIRVGIEHGVRKINIDTDCRLAMAAEIRRIAAEKRSEFDPRKFLQPSMDALKALCRQRYEAFGAAGQASRLRPLSLPEMAKRYRAGALNPGAPVQDAA
jgi:fructose-bisphosphate aldolase class II